MIAHPDGPPESRYEQFKKGFFEGAAFKGRRDSSASYHAGHTAGRSAFCRAMCLARIDLGLPEKGTGDLLEEKLKGHCEMFNGHPKWDAISKPNKA